MGLPGQFSMTFNKLAAQRHAAEVGLWVRGELKRLERQIVDAGLMPEKPNVQKKNRFL
tara:strand:+ start:841 stop:1014 length:174 start_codon:yes stop_codon:yes gene_type:complete